MQNGTMLNFALYSLPPDPIAAYPLKKVDRIYSAYHRTIANILPDVELHTFQNMQDAFMDYIPYRMSGVERNGAALKWAVAVFGTEYRSIHLGG
jgi:hypothetical protein